MATWEALVASGNPTFHMTPHYDGDGMIRLDLATIDDPRQQGLATAAWRLKVPAPLRPNFNT